METERKSEVVLEYLRWRKGLCLTMLGVDSKISRLTWNSLDNRSMRTSLKLYRNDFMLISHSVALLPAKVGFTVHLSPLR